MALIFFLKRLACLGFQKEIIICSPGLVIHHTKTLSTTKTTNYYYYFFFFTYNMHIHFSILSNQCFVFCIPTHN